MMNVCATYSEFLLASEVWKGQACKLLIDKSGSNVLLNVLECCFSNPCLDAGQWRVASLDVVVVIQNIYSTTSTANLCASSGKVAAAAKGKQYWQHKGDH